ncbi:MAG: ABC transporter, permease protein 2 (cluster 1, maltose/g3p/polyamine/iron), partial [uncultured Nocardioidaceae bacterium]
EVPEGTPRHPREAQADGQALPPHRALDRHGLPADPHDLHRAQDSVRRQAQPVRSLLVVLVGEHHDRVDRRELRQLLPQQLLADGAEHAAGRGALDDGRLRVRAAAVPGAGHRVLRRGGRPAGAVLHLHDPAVLPAAWHGAAGLPARGEPGAGEHRTVLWHVLHARLLLRPAGRARPGGACGRCLRVADLPQGDAAPGHLGHRGPVGLHLPDQLEQLPGAVALHPQRRVPAAHHRAVPLPRRAFHRHRTAGGGNADHDPPGDRAVRRDAEAGHPGLPLRRGQGL